MISKKRLFLITAIGFTLASTAIAYKAIIVPYFNIYGKVSIGELGPKTPIVRIGLDITVPEGLKVFKDVAKLSVPNNTCIRFRPLLESSSGNTSFTLSGRVFLRALESREKNYSYSILMPCMASKGLKCYRIMMLIPGYDTYLRTPGGKYSIDLELSWRALGYGRFSLGLYLEAATCSDQAVISLLGGMPKNVEGWETVEGSSRMRTLLIDHRKAWIGEGGWAEFKAWAWLFNPTGIEKPIYKILIYDREGKLVAFAIVLAEKAGSYYQIAVKIKLSIPGDYELVVQYPDNKIVESQLMVVRV